MNKEKRREFFVNEYKWLFKKKIFHRGKHDNKKIYENTIESYKEAMKNKKPIELDVQLSMDGEVICFHDANLKRLFNRERMVKDISYKRINKLRDDLKVPLLKDVLRLINGKVELMIEMKHINRKLNKVLVEKVCKLLKDYKGKYVIVSFNPYLLKLYRSLDKEVYLGRIGSSNTRGFIKNLITSKLFFIGLGKIDFISYDINNYDYNRLEKYRKKGYKIIGWTLKDTTREKELKKYFDNFIIEDNE